MPTVKPHETQSSYVSRAVPVIMQEGATQKQALGKAYGMFRSAKKKARRKSK
jgi:hypothetical protein